MDLSIERDGNNQIVQATLAPCGAVWTSTNELSLKAWLHTHPCDTPPDPEPSPEDHGEG